MPLLGHWQLALCCIRQLSAGYYSVRLGRFAVYKVGKLGIHLDLYGKTVSFAIFCLLFFKDYQTPGIVLVVNPLCLVGLLGILLIEGLVGVLVVVEPTWKTGWLVKKSKGPMVGYVGYLDTVGCGCLNKKKRNWLIWEY